MAKSHSLAGTSIPAIWLPKDRSMIDIARQSSLIRFGGWTQSTDGFVAHQEMGALSVLDFNTKPPTPFLLTYSLKDALVTAVTPLKDGKFVTVVEKASGEDWLVVWDAKNRANPIVTESRLLDTGRDGQWNTFHGISKRPNEVLLIFRNFANNKTVQSVRQYNEKTRSIDILTLDSLLNISVLDWSIIGDYSVLICFDFAKNNYRLRVYSFDKKVYTDDRKLINIVDAQIFPIDHQSFMVAYDFDKPSKNDRTIYIFTIDSSGKIVFPKLSIKAALYPNPCLTRAGELFLPSSPEMGDGPGLLRYNLVSQNAVVYPLKGPLEDMMLTPDGELGIIVREEGKPLICQFHDIPKIDERLIQMFADETDFPEDVSRMVLQYADFEKARNEKAPPFVMPRQNISENVSPLYLDVIKKIDRLRQQIAELKEQSSRAYLTPEKYVQLEDELKDGAVILKALKELEALFEKGDLSFQDCVKSIERAYPKFSSGKISGLLGWVSQTKVHAAFNSILRDLNKIPEREHGKLLQRDNPSPKKPSSPGRS